MANLTPRPAEGLYSRRWSEETDTKGRVVLDDSRTGGFWRGRGEAKASLGPRGWEGISPAWRFVAS